MIENQESKQINKSNQLKSVRKVLENKNIVSRTNLWWAEGRNIRFIFQSIINQLLLREKIRYGSWLLRQKFLFRNYKVNYSCTNKLLYSYQIGELIG